MSQAWPGILDELVETRRPALVGYAYVLTGDVAAAEDLVHDAILRTFSKPRGLAALPQAESYVRRAIATTFLNQVRRHRRFVERMHYFAPEDERGPESRVAARDAVHVALLGLSPRERACVVLRFYEDLAVADIAATLGISLGAAKRYLSDAAAKLRAALGEDFAIEGREAAPVASRGRGRKP